MSVLDELLAKEAGHLSMIQGLLMLVQLTQHGTQLQVTLAKVPQLEEFAADVELLSGLHYVLHLDVFL